MTFLNTSLYISIPVFIFLGLALGIVFAFIPAFVCAEMSIHTETGVAKAEYLFWNIITLIAFLSGWVLALTIMMEWVK